MDLEDDMGERPLTESSVRHPGLPGGGPAGSGGYDFQSRGIAFVAVHILAERPLEWLPLVQDIPISLLAETGRSGDDVRIDLRGTDVVIEGQAKKGLNGFAKLREALEGFAKDMPSAPNERGVLLVDPRTASPIRERFAGDLTRIAQGRRDGLGELTLRSIAWLEQSGAGEIVERLRVVTLAVEERSGGDRKLAIELLVPLFGDRDTAEQVWDALVSESLQLCKYRGRFTREILVAMLTKRGHVVLAASSARKTIHEKLDEIVTFQRAAAVQSVGGPTPGTASATSGPDVEWHARIDAARDLLNQGRGGTALELLDGLERQLNEEGARKLPQPTLVGSIRRRIESNRAAALIRLGQFAEGRVASLRSLGFDEDAPTYVVAARAHLLVGEKNEAARLARKALALSPGLAGAWSVLVEVGEATLGRLEGADEVPGGLKEDIGVRTAAAVAAMNRGDFANAEETLLRIEADGDADPERLFLLTQAIIRSRTTSMVRGGLAPAALARIDAIATKALSGLPPEEYSGTHEELLLLRASTRRMTGRTLEAMADAERAFRLARPGTGDRWRSAFMYGSLLLEAGREREAEGVLASLDGLHGERGAMSAVNVLRARILAKLGRADDVRPQLLSALTNAAGGERSATADLSSSEIEEPASIDIPALAARAPVDVALVVVECALESQLLEFAEDVLSAISPDDAGWLRDLYQARLSSARGAVSESSLSFERAARDAHDDSDPDTVRKIRFEYATALARRGDYTAAAAQFALGDAWSFGGLPRRGLIGSLLETGNAAEAQRLLGELTGLGAQEPWVILASARIAEARDDHAELVRHLQAYHVLYPEDHGIALRLAVALVKIGETSKAQDLLDALVGFGALAPRDRMNAAMILARLGRHGDAVREGLLAHRGDRESPEIASRFVFLVHQFEQAGGRPEAAEVGPETYVLLSPIRLGSPVSYTIYANPPVDASRAEILAGDVRYSDLMGKRVGDEVRLWKGLASEAVFRVTEIKSAVVHAFQDIISHFQERFPDNGAIQGFSVDDELSPEALQPIIALVHRQKATGERLLAHYDAHELPLGVLSRALHRSQPDVYWSLASRSQGYLFVEFAENELRMSSLRAASEASALVLTRSALLTMQSLENAGVPIMDALTKSGRQLIVTRSLLDEIEDEEREAAQWGGKARHILAAAPTGLAMHEVSEVEVAASHARAVRLVTWVREKATIAPRPTSALVPGSREWRELVGESSADALELCASEGATLMADDRGLRRLGLERVARFASCSTWAIIYALQSAGHLSFEEGRRAIRHVIALKHDFISVDVQLLIGSLRDSAFQFTAETTSVFDRLAGKDVAVESSAMVCALFLRELATDAIGAGALGAATQICAERMTRTNDIGAALYLLRFAARQALKLLPQALDAVMQSLSLFEASATRVSGLVGGRRTPGTPT